MEFSLLPIIRYFNTLPPEVFWVVQMLLCCAAILLLLKWFGKSGLFVFIGVTIIAANIEVLKTVKFAVFGAPVTIGTLLMSTTYLCVDILTEYYGPKVARKAVYLGFASIILMLVWMFVAMSYMPITKEQVVNTQLPGAFYVQHHLESIFVPSVFVLLASLISYLCSELSDVWIFSRIRSYTGKRFLWLRNNVSTMLSALLDNAIFNTLAWVVFTKKPLSFHVLVFTYILGTYVIRVVVSIVGTPVIYWAKAMLPEEDVS